MRINDAIIGVGLIIFALVVVWHTRTFPSFPGQKYGPALFPVLIGCGFVLIGLVLVFRGYVERRAVAWLSLEPWTRSLRLGGGFVLVLVAIVFFILASDALGFLLTSFVILAVLITWLGERPLPALGVAVGMTLFIDWFFGDIMRIPLPRGLLDLLS